MKSSLRSVKKAALIRSATSERQTPETIWYMGHPLPGSMVMKKNTNIPRELSTVVVFNGHECGCPFHALTTRTRYNMSNINKLLHIVTKCIGSKFTNKIYKINISITKIKKH